MSTTVKSRSAYNLSELHLDKLEFKGRLTNGLKHDGEGAVNRAYQGSDSELDIDPIWHPAGGGISSQNENNFFEIELNGGHTPSGAAVVIRNAEKSYVPGHPVLKGFNMTVPCGSIYGLLGHRESGMTTVLSCIAGLQKLDKGRIWVFGSVGVPGRNVGYMPQTVSLYNEFSIKEILNYFGSLNGMTRTDIKNQSKLLLSVLSLPEGSTRVGCLSGDQQRQVSLIVAILSNPELLVLDEPTVGLDPLIRQNIWNYLKKLTLSQRTTVIITTPYIEECRSADNIGVMRSGRLIAERETESLLMSQGPNNLATFFLDLSKRDAANESHDPDLEIFTEIPKNMASVGHEPDTSVKDAIRRVLVLTGKNLVIVFRKPLWLLFFVLFAAVTVAIANLTQGHDPKDLTIGIVNREVGVDDSSCGNFRGFPGECSVDMLSCHYLSLLDKDIFNLRSHKNETEALAEVQAGRSWGYLTFPEDFSLSLYQRISIGVELAGETFNSSQLIAKLDESSKFISRTIKLKMREAFQEFMTIILTNCGYDSQRAKFSLRYSDPLLGNAAPGFREHLSPGAGLALLFFLPILPTAVRLIQEKKSGTLDRSIVGGVKIWEIMVAYAISDFVFLILQSLATYIMMTLIFGVTVLGEDILLLILFMLAGCAGVSIGFLLGTLCKEEAIAATVARMVFMPSLTLSGALWPREGMSVIMQRIIEFLPCTLAEDAARSITSRGLEFTHPDVWPGFLTPTIYIIGFSLLTLLFTLRN